MNKARKSEIYEDFDENFCNTFNGFMCQWVRISFKLYF